MSRNEPVQGAANPCSLIRRQPHPIQRHEISPELIWLVYGRQGLQQHTDILGNDHPAVHVLEEHQPADVGSAQVKVQAVRASRPV